MNDKDPEEEAGNDSDQILSQAVVKELADAVDFSKAGSLRRLRDEVHIRLDSDWAEESQVCFEVLARIGPEADPDILIAEFFHVGNQDFWMNLILFGQVIDSAVFGLEHIVQLEQSLPPEVYRDMAIAGYLNAIKRWAGRYPELGEQLLDLIVTPEGADVRRLHVTILEGLGEAVGRNDYDRGRFEKRLRTSLAAGDDLRAGVAMAHPALVSCGAVTQAEYRLRLSEWISALSAEKVVAAAVQSIFFALRLDRPGDNYVDLLRAASADDRPQVRMSLMRALQPLAESETEDARQLLNELLVSFASPGQENGAIDELSWLLFSAAKKHPHLVMKFLRAWAERADDKPLWHSTRFLHVINHIPVDELVSEATTWIVASQRLEEIGLHLILDERQLRSLVPSAVANLTPGEVEICAMVFSYHDYRVGVAHLLAALVKEALVRDDCDHLSSLFEQLLTHIVESYPGTAARFISTIEESRTKTGRRLARSLRRQKSRHEDTLKAVHRMPDFFPAEERQRIYQRFDREFHREVHRTDVDDPGRFPLTSMLRGNRVQLLGGSSILSTSARTFGAVQPLGRIEVETEPSLLEVLDQHSEQMRRFLVRARIEELRQIHGDRYATPTT